VYTLALVLNFLLIAETHFLQAVHTFALLLSMIYFCAFPLLITHTIVQLNCTLYTHLSYVSLAPHWLATNAFL